MKYFMVFGQFDKDGAFDITVAAEVYPTRKDLAKNVKSFLENKFKTVVLEEDIVFTGIQEITGAQMIEWNR